MRLIKSIKQQTFALVVGLTLGLSVIFSSLAVITAFMVEDMLLSNVLAQRADYVEQYYRSNGSLPTLADHNLQLFTRLDEVPSWAKERMARHNVSGEIFTPDKSHYHYRKLALGESSGYLLVEVSSLLVVTNQVDILVLFLIVLMVVVCLAIGLAVRFSRKIVNPVLALTDAVVANEQLAEKILLPTLQFELGYLSNALQESFNKLHHCCPAKDN